MSTAFEELIFTFFFLYKRLSVFIRNSFFLRKCLFISSPSELSFITEDDAAPSISIHRKKKRKREERQSPRSELLEVVLRLRSPSHRYLTSGKTVSVIRRGSETTEGLSESSSGLLNRRPAPGVASGRGPKALLVRNHQTEGRRRDGSFSDRELARYRKYLSQRAPGYGITNTARHDIGAIRILFVPRVTNINQRRQFLFRTERPTERLAEPDPPSDPASTLYSGRWRGPGADEVGWCVHLPLASSCVFLSFFFLLIHCLSSFPPSFLERCALHFSLSLFFLSFSFSLDLFSTYLSLFYLSLSLSLVFLFLFISFLYFSLLSLSLSLSFLLISLLPFTLFNLSSCFSFSSHILSTFLSLLSFLLPLSLSLSRFSFSYLFSISLSSIFPHSLSLIFTFFLISFQTFSLFYPSLSLSLFSFFSHLFLLFSLSLMSLSFFPFLSPLFYFSFSLTLLTPPLSLSLLFFLFFSFRFYFSLFFSIMSNPSLTLVLPFLHIYFIPSSLSLSFFPLSLLFSPSFFFFSFRFYFSLSFLSRLTPLSLSFFLFFSSLFYLSLPVYLSRFVFTIHLFYNFLSIRSLPLSLSLSLSLSRFPFLLTSFLPFSLF
ncbi:unnamed protein product [Acanthosepion pharaonis]|uniref:Uncharacterized protein n=1 Tax=Acanthosepion pharaonis TaxID=158019 RepID=A0A812DXH6_ACAPH|nr:unnamed protein product [Sepia pharaonis]